MGELLKSGASHSVGGLSQCGGASLSLWGASHSVGGLSVWGASQCGRHSGHAVSTL